MTAAATLPPGTICGRYRIESILGSGGMGTVYKATHVDTGAGVAVKSLHPHLSTKSESQKRFLREARAAMAAVHPNVVKIHETFEHDDVPMLAMELLDGQTLESLLGRERRLPLGRLARIMIRVTSAVGTAHAMGIVHRDLKPENIFLGARDEAEVKVLDFGIAKLTATHGAAAETAALTRTGALMGTPYYMSPEQAFGEKRIDQRSDIWSLGIIFYRSLSGVLPTRGDSFGDVFKAVVSGTFQPIEQLVPGLPAEMAALIGSMLERDPSKRPWDLREVYNVLERHADISAPRFGTAVAPLFTEVTSDTENTVFAPSANTPSGPQGTLALTPSAIRLGPPSASATPSGSTPSRSTAPPVSGAPTLTQPPMNSRLGLLLGGVALIIFAALAAYLFALRP